MRSYQLYEAGRRAALAGIPYNVKNSIDWQMGWKDAKDDDGRDNDDWMIDPEMGARG